MFTERKAGYRPNARMRASGGTQVCTLKLYCRRRKTCWLWFWTITLVPVTPESCDSSALTEWGTTRREQHEHLDRQTATMSFAAPTYKASKPDDDCRAGRRPHNTGPRFALRSSSALSTNRVAPQRDRLCLWTIAGYQPASTTAPATNGVWLLCTYTSQVRRCLLSCRRFRSDGQVIRPKR